MKEVDEIQWALIQSIRGFKQNTITDGEGNLGQHTRALFSWFTYNSQDFSVDYLLKLKNKRQLTSIPIQFKLAIVM